MNVIEQLVLERWNQYMNFMMGHIFLFAFVTFVALSLVIFFAAFIISKHHKRIKSKFLVYILNNSLISILAQDLLLAAEVTDCNYINPEDNEIIDLTAQSFLTKIRHKFGTMLRKVSDFYYIADCKNYFRFK